MLSRGTRLGRYRILTELASGGMAQVYFGVGKSEGGFQRIFAIKCCHPHLVKEPGFAEMFLDEARLAAGIHHTNVIPALDVGRDGDVLYLVMEYVEGERLSALLRSALRDGVSPPIPVLARIFHDLLLGLHAAHDATRVDGSPLELVHRDVSPQNVLVGVDGVTRVMDFGVAKSSIRAATTSRGVVKGKISFVAPEQLRGEPIDRRVDVWAAGVTLWEALTLRKLFQGESHADTMHAILHAEIPPPSRVRPDVDPLLDAVVMRALERVPSRRWPSALDMAVALEEAVSLAPPRAVGSFVQGLAGQVLEERRQALRDAHEAARTNPRFAALRDSAPPPRSEPVSLDVTLPDPTPLEALALAARDEAPSAARLNRNARFWTIAALLLAVALGSMVALLVTHRERQSLPPAATPAPPIVSEPTRQASTSGTAAPAVASAPVAAQGEPSAQAAAETPSARSEPASDQTLAAPPPRRARSDRRQRRHSEAPGAEPRRREAAFDEL